MKKYPSQSLQREAAINRHIPYASLVADRKLKAHLNAGGLAEELRIYESNPKRTYIHHVWNDFFHEEMNKHIAKINAEIAD